MERDTRVCAPVGDGDGRGPITMNLPIEAGERGIVILTLQPGEAVPAMYAARGAGAEAACAILNAGLGDEAEGGAANGGQPEQPGQDRRHQARPDRCRKPATPVNKRKDPVGRIDEA